jgi:hypothetical protein
MTEPTGSKMDAVKAAMKRALITFLIADALLIAGALGIYMLVLRPHIGKIEAARDREVRVGMAMAARVHAVEGRLALQAGDVAGAQRAAGDLQLRLDGLLGRVPKADAQESQEVSNLKARAALVVDEVTRDPETAKHDFELVDARLSSLYPVLPK